LTSVVAPIADEQALCPNCGRSWGPGIACQHCDQVEGLPIGILLTSPGRRLGAYALDVLLLVVTLVIGWLVWSLIVWGRGQTPGKQLIGLRCVKEREKTSATWGTMFLREVVCKGLLFAVITTFTFGIGYVLYFMLLWDKKNQELWDKMAGTIVVDDPQGILRSEPGAAARPAAALAPPMVAADQPIVPPPPPVVAANQPVAPRPVVATDQPVASPPPVDVSPAPPTVVGSSTPVLVVETLDGQTSRVPLASETVVGRENADIVLDDEQISRRHAIFRLRHDSSVEISDLGSSNGTFVNGTRIEEPVILARDDVVMLGRTQLTIELPARGVDLAATLVSDH
jgi:uncharacterized RDD family membrane protein YckC